MLNGQRSTSFYLRLATAGFLVGFIANGYELARAIRTDFDLIAVFGYLQGTYHVGRLGMALGWLGLVMLMCRGGVLAGARRRWLPWADWHSATTFCIP